jgi:hypothetical protein
VVVRDRRGRILGASDGGRESRSVPELVLSADTLLPATALPSAAAGRAQPLPVEGARVELVVGNSPVGWMDLWGDGTPANSQARRALSDFARFSAALAASSAASA